MTKLKKDRYLLLLFLAAFWVVGLILGRFFDLDIARRVYLENNKGAVAWSVVGIYMFYGSFVFLLGVQFKQCFLAVKKTSSKVLVTLFFSYCALSTSTYSGATILSDSVLGFLYPGNSYTLVQCMITGAIMFLPLYPLGVLLNGKKCDKKAIRDLIVLLSVMTVCVFFSNIVKSLVMRPRYRITLLGYEGIDFLPVFNFLKNGRVLKAAYGLVTDDLASFFSGHAMNAMICLIILPAYRYVIPWFQRREKALIGLALLIAIPIDFSRMMLGDHYLSDVSFGSLVGLMFCLIYYRILLKVREPAANGTQR